MTMESREKRRHSSSKPASGAADSDDSPKHAKRDRKPATERHIPEVDPPLVPSDNDRFRKRRLQDPLPLEENPRGHSERKDPIDPSINHMPVNPTHVPRSSSYFQHDDRGGVLSGRSSKRRAPDDRWVKSHNNDKQRESSPTQSRRGSRHEASQQVPLQAKPDDAWGHDKFLEMQAEGPERKRRQSPPERARQTGRRTFTEKPPIRLENREEAQKGDDDPEKRAERRYPDMNLARRERERYHQRGEDLERGRWMDSDRYQQRRGNGRYLGEGNRRFDPSRRNNHNGVPAVTTDKWMHDRFEELNRSPSPKKEEDSIAQIEALLAA